MVEKNVEIRNHAGIHCRPASSILSALSEYPGHEFRVVAPGRDETELNSILSLISLGLQCGDKVTIRVTGPDEEEACDKIAGLFAFEFDFPPR